MSGNVINGRRRAALAVHATYYFTGKPCRRGHIAIRYVSTSQCTACLRERYLNTRPMRLVQMKRYQALPEQKEKNRQRNSAFRKLHPEIVRRWQQKYASTINGASKIKVAQNLRRARIKSTVGKLTAADWQQIVRRASRCYHCNKRFTTQRRPTLDHVVAIANGGHHDITNVIAACLSCNTSKGARRINPATGQGLLL